MKGNSIHTATCFLGTEAITHVINNSVPCPVFSNIRHIIASISGFTVFAHDKYHQLILDFDFTLDYYRVSLIHHHYYAQGDYLLIRNVLRLSDCSHVLNENSFDSAVNILTVIVRDAINISIKLRDLSPRANYTNQETAACRRSYCQLLRIEGATLLAWRFPTAVFSVF
jgi:hypothetical protein